MFEPINRFILSFPSFLGFVHHFRVFYSSLTFCSCSSSSFYPFSAASSFWRKLRGGPVRVRASSIDLSSGVRPSPGLVQSVVTSHMCWRRRTSSPSLFCNSPFPSPITFQNRRNVLGDVNVILIRTESGMELIKWKLLSEN
ncbi:hypothetical protein LR48_Vigan86s001300 [Vigna angularis]|uniref:Uncharacterized protein n=1 Tax=Phaseolus angularis TaxID=3914 RepID=A0A0L9T5B2_PHAAN|nr:hypothetical protein LR48_Vigan86s001300 [Vigna angularis]